MAEAGAVDAGAAAGAAGAAEGGAGAQQGGLDLGPLLERFDGLDGKVGQMQALIDSRLQGEPQGQQQEPAASEFDVGGLFDPAAAEMDPAQAQALLTQFMEQHSSKAVQQAVEPLMAQIQNIQIGLDAEQLTAKYPALQDEKVAGPVVEAARAAAERMGQPALATNMQFLEFIYKAQMADKYAAGEVPAGAEKSFALESAAGSSPQGGQEPNIAERIVAQRRATQPWAAWK